METDIPYHQVKDTLLELVNEIIQIIYVVHICGHKVNRLKYTILRVYYAKLITIITHLLKSTISFDLYAQSFFITTFLSEKYEQSYRLPKNTDHNLFLIKWAITQLIQILTFIFSLLHTVCEIRHVMQKNLKDS